MLPSHWLYENVSATTLYAESTLERLRVCEIGYAGGILTSHMMFGVYPTYGRLASVRFVTPREAVTQYGAKLRPGADDEKPMVFGFDIATAIWRLVHPITIETPPSQLADDLSEKFQRDLAAIRSYGY